jgi:phosphoribosylaminoimidazolecarboxamide formyltransferase / IMP cyclohydrolase
MNKKIQSALISVFYKEGLEPILKQLHKLGVKIYSTGGTQQFIEKLNIPCISVESLTSYPSILGGRVKTLHPSVFGGILGRREVDTDILEMKTHHIPEIDLVIIDLYPFEETLAHTLSPSFSGGKDFAEKSIIEKIDIGGPSMIRAAAKNFNHVTVIAAKNQYAALEQILISQQGEITLEQRRNFATQAFEIVMHYDVAIHNYFSPQNEVLVSSTEKQGLRYGENPHQEAYFYGHMGGMFTQIHGKELSYNNLVDADAAIQLILEFNSDSTTGPGAEVKEQERIFAIIKHTNVCGIASRKSLVESWNAALAGDRESAFGGVLVCNGELDKITADAIQEIFFEVLIAPSFSKEALEVLQAKKNRILLQLSPSVAVKKKMFKSMLNGVLTQQIDEGNYTKWEEVGGRQTSISERDDLVFANLVCKHLKSNAIAIVINKQLIGKGCGQTSRVDALRQAIEKAKQSQFDLRGTVLASDAFFPFNDCVTIAHNEGIVAFIQPGGSIRDKDSIDYCKEHNLAMVLTGMRHFRH